MTGFSLHVCTVSFPTAILQTGSEKGALGLEWFPYVSTGPLSCRHHTNARCCCRVSITGWRPTQGGTRLGTETAGKVCIPSAVTHHVSDAAHTSHAIIGNCCAIMQSVKKCVWGSAFRGVDVVQMLCDQIQST